MWLIAKIWAVEQMGEQGRSGAPPSPSGGGAEASGGLLGRDGRARCLCGGADLAVSDLGNPCCVLLSSAVMGGRSVWSDLPWKTVPKQGNQASQEGKKVEDESLYFCLGRCALESYWKS